MKKLAVVLFSALLLPAIAHAQVLLSGGMYSQNFDYPTLSYQSSQGTNWTNGVTIPGWYAETSFGAITNYRVSGGGVNNGALYSYGIGGVSSQTDRALGSLASSSYNNIAHGVRMTNDTGLTIDSFTISYTGEQWRNGAPATPAVQSLTFSYRIDNAPITSPDWANTGTPAWTAVPSLTFNSPVLGGTAGALDGNVASNRTALSATLSGLTVNSGQEVFFRWYDLNDASNDHGLAVDDLTISFTTIPEPTTAALVGLGLLLIRRRRARIEA